MRAHQILQLRFPVLRYSISPLFSISTSRPKTLSRQKEYTLFRRRTLSSWKEEEEEEEEEEIIWWTVYKDLATSTGTEKIRRIPKFTSRMLQ
jgi:hypothetical protein